MAHISVPPARDIRSAPPAERCAVLNCNNALLSDAHRALIQALKKIDAAREFEKRNGLFAHADAMFDLHVSIGYRAYVFERLIEALEIDAASGNGSLSRNFMKYQAKLARPI